MRKLFDSDGKANLTGCTPPRWSCEKVIEHPLPPEPFWPQANRQFIEKNPAAAKLFSVMKLPVADINAQNMAMHNGANKPADIERQTQGWIKAHQKTFNGWIATARAAASNPAQ